MAKPELAVHPERMPQSSQLFGLPVRDDILFTNKNGVDKPRLHKRAEKLLQKLQEPLRRALEPGETILYGVQAQSPMSALEQAFVGWAAYILRRSMLVITNKRLLQFSIGGNNSWKRSLRVVSWGDVQQAKVSGFISGQLILKYRDGKQDKFWGIGSGDTGKLRAVVNAVMPASSTEQTSARAPVSLCPECYKPLTPRVYVCPSCGLPFKNEKTLLWMGIFVPGGAYFYTGFPFLGVLTAVVELFLLIEIVGLLILMVEARNTPHFAGYAASLAWVAFFFGLETLITIGHCQTLIRGFLPAKNKQPEALMSSSSAAGKGF